MAEPTSMKLGDGLVVTLSTSNAQSSAIGTANSAQPSGVTITRFVADIDVWFSIGLNPVAVTETAPATFLPALTVEYFDVPFGHKVGAIAAGAGKLSLTPMSKT